MAKTLILPKMKIYVLEQRDAIYGGDKDRYLTYSYRKFDGKIKYVIDKNDTIKEFVSVYYKKMIREKKDTIHVSLKEFNNHFKYIIDNFFEGDSIYLHFHDHKRWTDVPLRVSFN